eukprot:Em0024g78a
MLDDGVAIAGDWVFSWSGVSMVEAGSSVGSVAGSSVGSVAGSSVGSVAGSSVTSVAGSSVGTSASSSGATLWGTALLMASSLGSALRIADTFVGSGFMGVGFGVGVGLVRVDDFGFEVGVGFGFGFVRVGFVFLWDLAWLGAGRFRLRQR